MTRHEKPERGRGRHRQSRGRGATRPRSTSPQSTDRTTRTDGASVTRLRRPSRATRWWSLLVSAGAVATLVLLGGDWLIHQSFFSVSNLTVTGNVHESSAAVERESGLLSHPPMWGLNRAQVRRRLESFPWIDDVTVTQHWPHSVQIVVHEARAVALVQISPSAVDLVSDTGRRLGPAPAGRQLPQVVYAGKSTTWPFTTVARNAVTVAEQLPVAFSGQVRQVIVSGTGSVTLQLTTPLSFIIGPPTDLRAKFVSIASAIAKGTFAPGDVVDATVPSELSVTPPGT